MNLVSRVLAGGLTIAFGTIAHGAGPVTVDGTLTQFCEPLIAGSSLDHISSKALAEGFEPSEVGGQPVLVYDQVVLGVSENPRVCLVQAAPNMTFAQGVSLVDRWAARHEGATLGSATKGPDGARVRVWTVEKKNMYLLVSEQPSSTGGKVLNFILAPMPGN